MICESNSSLTIFDSKDVEIDVWFVILFQQSVDLEVANQIDEYIKQVIQQINHPEDMIISLNKRV